MAKPPAEVRFPGDKNRRKRIRMRGIKQASKEIQNRLDSNLEELVEDPEVFLPEIRGNVDHRQLLYLLLVWLVPQNEILMLISVEISQ